MATVLRVLICVIFANLTAAQVTNSTTTVASVTTSVLSVSSSTSSVISPTSSTVSSTSRAGSSSSPSVTSTTQSLALTTSSVAPTTSSVAPSTSSPSVIPASSTTPSPSSSTTEPSSTSSITSSTSSGSSSVSTSLPSSTRSETSSSHSSASQTKSETYTYSSVSSSVLYQSTVYSTANVIVTTQPDGQTSQLTEYTVVQTSVPATTLYSTTVVTSTESPTGVAGLQSNSISSSSNNLSTGAKAGIGAGVGVAVVAAAIIGALYAMRRRRRHNAIAESDRYPPSYGPSMVGGYGGAIGKIGSQYTESETRGPHSPPPMHETNLPDRYPTPGVSSQRTSLPPNSRMSEISSTSGSEPMSYRPGPGRPAVVGQTFHPGIEELPEQNTYHQQPDYAGGTAGNPFHAHGGEETPSVYSDDGNKTNNTSTHPVPSGVPRQASPAALELSADTVRHGYRGVDPEQPYHTRSQLTKPLTQQGRYDVAHNF